MKARQQNGDWPMAPGSRGHGLSGALHDLAGTFPGGLIAWWLTSAAAGAVPVLLSNDLSGIPLLALAAVWLGHLAAAGMMIWGIAFVLIHVWCIYSLVATDDSKPRALAVAFAGQLTVSTAVTAILGNENRGPVILAQVVCLLVLWPCLLWAFGFGQTSAPPNRRTLRRPAAPMKPSPGGCLKRESPSKPAWPSAKRSYDRAAVAAKLRAKVRSHFHREQHCGCRGQGVEAHDE